MPTPSLPAILLAFADDRVAREGHLDGLLRESKLIVEALTPLVNGSTIELLQSIHRATVKDVRKAFRASRNLDRICIFHFAGHASSSTLLFEDDAGRPEAAHAKGLAGYLGLQRGLVLVVLNGCCTEQQVQRLRADGIKAVVATTQNIKDEVAAEFAAEFYAELATRSLQDAFDNAVKGIQTRNGDDPRAVMRDVTGDATAKPLDWPWLIDCDPEFKTWSLCPAIVQAPIPAPEARSRAPWLHALVGGRRWPGRLLFVVAAVILVLAMVLSNLARRGPDSPIVDAGSGRRAQKITLLAPTHHIDISEDETQASVTFHSDYSSLNHYILVTPLATPGDQYVGPGPIRLDETGTAVAIATLGGEEVGKGEIFSIEVIATTETLRVGLLPSDHATLKQSNTVEVARQVRTAK